VPTPVPSPTPEREKTAPPSGEFTDIPIYRGAKPAAEEAQLMVELKALGTLRKNEVIRVFTVPDSLDKVVDFYKEQMPRHGWEVEISLTAAGNGGVMQWKKAQWVAVIIIGEREGKRLLLIDRAERGTPVTTPITTPLTIPITPRRTPTPATPTGRVYAGPDVSADGVELTRFSVEGPEPARVGNTLTVRFTYRNTKSEEMVFKPYGFVVGCRDPEGRNRDFGHREVTLKPGASYDFSASIQVDKAGLWHFWPGYYLGHWGPPMWHERVIAVE